MSREIERERKRAVQLERRQYEYLIKEEHLEIFTTWWVFGGREHGISPMEAAAMPADMRRDFMTILTRISEDRDWREAQAEQEKERRAPWIAPELPDEAKDKLMIAMKEKGLWTSP